MLTSNSRVSKNDSVPWRIIEEEAVLVDVERGNVVQLNEVAAFIWSQIDSKRTAGEITECVYNSFEVNRDRAQKDTLELLNSLLEKNIIMIK